MDHRTKVIRDSVVSILYNKLHRMPTESEVTGFLIDVETSIMDQFELEEST